MPRTLLRKELVNTELANEYGGWIYCQGCNQTVGYLCYITYDHFHFDYECRCGSSGSAVLSFAPQPPQAQEQTPLIQIKNRQCCPTEQSPLFSIVEKRLSRYHYDVTCSACGKKYATAR